MSLPDLKEYFYYLNNKNVHHLLKQRYTSAFSTESGELFDILANPLDDLDQVKIKIAEKPGQYFAETLTILKNIKEEYLSHLSDFASDITTYEKLCRELDNYFFELIETAAGPAIPVSRTSSLDSLKQQNEQLVDELRNKAFELEAIVEANKLISGNLNIDSIVQHVVDLTTQLSKAQFGAFFYNLVNAKGESYTLYVISGVDKSHFSKFPMPRNTKVFAPTFHGTGTLRSEDITKDPRYGHTSPYFGMPKGHLPVRSYLAVPVKSRSGEVLGGLFYGHSEVGVFTEASEKVVEAITSHVAIALENAKLFNGLKESEEKFRFMSDIIPQMIWTTDVQGSPNYFNRQWYEFTGFDQGNLNVQDWISVLHQEDVETTLNTWNYSLKTGEPYEIEYRLKRKEDGEYRWQLARAMPMKDNSGNVIKWFGTCTDIHDQKLYEENLKLQARVLQSMKEGVSVCNEQGMIIYTNPAEDEMFGYEPKELIGQHVSIQNSYPEEENLKVIENVINHLKTYGVWEGDWMNIRKDGTKFITRATISALDVAGTTHFICVQKDITEEIRNKEALDYQSKLNKTITDNATSCLFMMNQEGYCTFMNPAGEKMFGYTFEEIRSKPLHYMIHHKKQDGSPYPKEECPIGGALESLSEIKDHQDHFFRKDGSMFPVSCSASPIFENDIPVATVIEIRDITEEKKADLEISERNKDLQQINDELLKINNDLDNFIYTASHDLKAPVSNIEGLMNTLTGILEEKGRKDEEVEHIMSLIETSVTRFQRTIYDLTEVSKTQKNINEEIGNISVKEIVEEVKFANSQLISKSNAFIEENIPHDAALQFNRANFLSIVYNLLSNAIKYKSPLRPPHIRLSWYEEGGSHVLEVSDNGLGLRKDQHGKIFQMFKRLHDHVEGSGVGLYIVKRIIDNSGGSIEIQSEEGIGTTFKIFFPV